MATENSFDMNALTDPDMAGTSKGFDPRNRHPDYMLAKERWATAHDMYLGADGVIPKADTYVPRRMAGETEDAYEERKALLHVPGLTGALIDSIVGLWARKSPEEDTWGALGPEDEGGDVPEGSTAWMLKRNADRERTTWDNHRRGSATWLCVFNRTYTLVDTNRPAGEMTAEQAQQAGVRPFVRQVQPLGLVDWVEVDGKKVEAVLLERSDVRTSLDEGEGRVEDRYLRLTLSGWERYRVVKEGDREKVEKIGDGTYAYLDPTTKQRRLPLVEKVLPMPRHAAYNLARIELALVNHDSHLDSLERAGALGQYLTVQGDEEEVRKNVRTGDKVLPFPPNSERPGFIGHGMEPAQHLEERIQKLGERFWRAAMYEFSDRAAERTATQIDQEWASGIGAFLTLLGGALEEGENEEKALLAQAAGATDGGETKFAKEYRVEDVIGELTRLKDLLFGAGDAVPLSPNLRAATAAYMVKRLDDQTGILSEAEDMDVDEELRDEADRRALDKARMDGLVGDARDQPGFPEESAA